MWNYILFFYTAPIIEWGIHILLHAYENKNHKIHHLDVYSNEFRNFNSLKEMEILPPFVIVTAYYFQFWYVFIFLTRYWICHTLIHYYDFKIEYLKNLKKHHILHHKFKNYNFAVSGIYPDFIFGTYKATDYIYKRDLNINGI